MPFISDAFHVWGGGVSIFFMHTFTVRIESSRKTRVHQYNAINRKLNGAVYCVHMTNNGVTVNIECLHYSYSIDLLQQIHFSRKCTFNMHAQRKTV